MNIVVQIEHRASSRWGKHEGEPSFGLCDRLSRTRDNSQRQLPTDQDYAVPTREYQTDQSSLKTAPTAARSVLGKRRNQRQQTLRMRGLTRSLHIRRRRSNLRGFKFVWRKRVFTVWTKGIRARPEKKAVHFRGKENSTLSLDVILRGRSRNTHRKQMMCTNISRKSLILE